MLFIKPERPSATPAEARARYRFAMSALAVSVGAVLTAMAVATVVDRPLERGDRILFAIVLACLAVLVPAAVAGQRRLMAQAARIDGKRPRRDR